MAYKDYMVRATAGNAQIRAFAATTKDLAEYGRKAHGLSPIAAAALGRLMTGTVMMGTMMDNDSDLITVKMDGDGPLKSVLATADNKGNVKGYVSNPYVIMEPNASGHLNVGGGIGEG
ncbi:MAG: Hsp33 family molecular chaperone HslO, partial [Butyrivibrio sp.]|nr:Hsp33 family molecular chaperone HslO [Butyrivibrio sp.]